MYVMSDLLCSVRAALLLQVAMLLTLQEVGALSKLYLRSNRPTFS
jgi:hypothetical protein